MTRVVYSLKKDYDYPYFLPVDVNRSTQFRVKCDSRLEGWQPPEIHLKGGGRLGDFCHFDEGYLIAAPRAVTLLRDFFEEAAELLPLYHKNIEYRLVNVLRCVDALDENRCVKHPVFGRFDYIRLAFFPEILPVSGLFKIPQSISTTVFVCVNDLMDKASNFKWMCEYHEIKGILFEEVWQES